jgi:NADH-quinone oxidoreductase subunit L
METLQAIFPERNFTLLAVILVLPLLGALVNGLFGRRLGKEAVSLMALTAIGGSFLASVATFLMLRAKQEASEHAARLSWTGWKWLDLSRTNEMNQLRDGAGMEQLGLDVAFSVDALSGTMALIVTGIGFLIHLYSTKYMQEDAGYHRFFAYLNLFIFAMLVLILGDSLPILFVGWEGVGLCSYLLIGYWYSDTANAAAGKKAFITNRIGDFGLLVAMALLLRYTGALTFDGVASGAAGLLKPVTVWQIPWLGGVEWLSWLAGPHQVTGATLVGLALFLGCAGKSAQIPLYVWLPDAMAGPTPVSALIHAATMVTAGVYLVCRMAPVFVMSPAAMFTVALIGVLTAVFAATIAFAQRDIKKVLAYSTVSQLGFMFLGVGVGAFVAGFFHVITHAFFKACLFLGAGSVIHAMHARIHDTNASQDIRNMGGLKQYLPWTHLTFLASTAAIIGFPLTSGFFSKDAILLGALTSSIKPPIEGGRLGDLELFQWPTWAPTVLFGLGVAGAVMTAFYMVRLYWLTFQGEFKGWKIVKGWQPVEPEHHGEGHAHHHNRNVNGPEPHESPWQMTLPLAILGALAVFGGLWSAHLLHMDSMDRWLAPVFATARQAVEVAEQGGGLVLGLAVTAFALGAGGAYMVYGAQAGTPAEDFVEKYPRVHQSALDKWYVDEFYDEFVIGTVDFIADICVWVDKYIVDGIIARLSSWLVLATGFLLRHVQTGRVQAYAAAMMVGLAGVGWFLTAPQPAAAVSGSEATGEYRLNAAAGFGYGYRWDADGDGTFDSEDFGSQRDLDVTVAPGEARTVVLEVQNAFGRVRQRRWTFSRPDPAAPAEPAAEMTGAAARDGDGRLAQGQRRAEEATR